MAQPKYKTRRSKTRSRKAHNFYQQLEVIELSHCPRCHALKPAHFACPACGFYKGEQAYRVKEKEEAGAAE